MLSKRHLSRSLTGAAVAAVLSCGVARAQEGVPAIPAPEPVVATAEAVLEGAPLDVPVGVVSQEPAGPVYPGWWIRINPSNVADHLYWRFGAAANRLGTPVPWVKGEHPDRIQLPVAQQQLPTLHIAALGMPPREPVSFCVFFGERGVALVEFVQEKNLMIAQLQTDPQCTP